MHRALLAAVAAMTLVLSAVPGLSADVRKRWQLDFEADKPFTYTYRDSRGHGTQYWVLTYHVVNSGDVEVPLVLDFFLKTIHSADPVDVKNARTYHQGWYPIVENHVVAQLEKMDSTMDSAALEAAVKKLQDGGKYLDMSQVRQKGTLAPKGEFTGIVLYESVPWGFVEMDFLVSGLMDNVHFKEHKPGETPEEAKVKYEFENRILRLVYTHPGDEFYGQTKPIEFLKKDWLVIPLGAVGDRRTLDLLVDALSLADDVARKSANDLLVKLVDQNFQYDAGKSVADNADAIHNWRSWVNQNKFNLKWDDVTMHFVHK